ncbi:MAG: hypothetical protein HPY57_14025 [Ignavibacteria bacterium]|nr:hypothetical protein [Ignavibacteria bacterium]
MTQKNSFISILEKIAQLNKNNVEVLTKLNDIVASNKNSVTVNYQEDDGRVIKFELPTVGWLKKEIDIANSNIKKLTTIEGDNSVIIIDENTSRKIKSVDLNREPTQIGNLNIPSIFSQNNNWFFEGLINPTLSIELDLTGQITDNVNKVLSRRYILKFEKNEDGTLTTNGQNSLTSFENNFLNRNDFTIETFLNWLNNPTNLGILDKENENLYRDDQYFDLNYKVINYKGYFNVLKIERDSINNKLWYHLNTLTYYDRNSNTRTLAVGDILSVNVANSYTKYRVLEINTSSSLFRISVERIEGYDPIPIGTGVLEFYSTLESNSKVKVTIGFDEYNVIFLKPINTDNNIICASWSKGMAFYTNDLVLDTDNSLGMTDFYLNYVYDYGAILKDMVSKRIPTQYASKPNKPILISDNFKVVQINKHLTDTKDFKTLKKLHAQKNSTKSKLSEIDQAIIQKKVELNTKSFKSAAEKSKAQNELNKLIQQQESETKLYSSYVSQITNSRAEQTSDPKFRVRGFWDIPDPILKSGYRPQEVIGFEIQYRYGSKLGTDNTTDGFEMKKSTVSTTSLPNNQQFTVKTAYFSQWVSIKSDIRKRTYDNTTGNWYWEIEDVSDADTPNINQLDIPIQRNEKVDIRIRSISEVGYPESPIYSDWSEIITIEFPDNLNEVLGENAFILQDATREEMRVSFENELSSKGVLKHVGDSFYVNEQYFAHTDKTLATSFKDAFGNTMTLFDYLKQMSDKITALEETIKRAKGEVKVTLFKGTEETEIINGSVINVVVNCEDYMVLNSSIGVGGYTSKVFQNNVYMIQDYYLQLENVSKENDLGLFTITNALTGPIINTGPTAPSFISSDGFLYPQLANQYIYIYNTANIDGSQITLYGGSDLTSYNDALATDYKNVSGSLSSALLSVAPTENIWSTTTNTKRFGATIHPYIEYNNAGQSSTIVDKNTQNIHIISPQETEKIPIQIYFKPDMYDSGATWTANASDTPLILKKALRFHFEEESKSRPFEFTIIFKLIRHRQFAIPSTSEVISSTTQNN